MKAAEVTAVEVTAAEAEAKAVEGAAFEVTAEVTVAADMARLSTRTVRGQCSRISWSGVLTLLLVLVDIRVANSTGKLHAQFNLKFVNIICTGNICRPSCCSRVIATLETKYIKLH